jgi:hypothetical protein
VEMNTPCTSILLAVERDTLCTFKLQVVESDTPCSSIDDMLMPYDVEVNARMSECQRKVSPASACLQVVNLLRPTSASCHQGQSITTGHGLVGHCPSMQTRTYFHHFLLGL